MSWIICMIGPGGDTITSHSSPQFVPSPPYSPPRFQSPVSPECPRTSASWKYGITAKSFSLFGTMHTMKVPPDTWGVLDLRCHFLVNLQNMSILDEQVSHLLLCDHGRQPIYPHLKFTLRKFPNHAATNDSPGIFHFKKAPAAHVLCICLFLQKDLEFQSAGESPHSLKIMVSISK